MINSKGKRQASDTTLRPDPNEVVPRVVAGIENILRAASKQFTIKRFVLTSSSTAVLIPKPNEKRIVGAGKSPEISRSERVLKVQFTDTWNDDAVRAAYSNDTPRDKKPYIVYAASKTEGERSAWNWVAENKPSLEFNVVIPNVNVSDKFGSIQINQEKLLTLSPW
jgi:nucleoside-diphosphate-sugar epimerase